MLHLDFNFHQEMWNQDLAIAIALAFRSICADHLTSERLTFGWQLYHPTLFGGRPFLAVKEHLLAHGVDPGDMWAWNPYDALRGSCTHRGFRGASGGPPAQQLQTLPRPQGWKGHMKEVGLWTSVSLGVGLIVVFWPVTAAVLIKRKRDKGEW